MLNGVTCSLMVAMYLALAPFTALPLLIERLAGRRAGMLVAVAQVLACAAAGWTWPAVLSTAGLCSLVPSRR